MVTKLSLTLSAIWKDWPSLERKRSSMFRSSELSPLFSCFPKSSSEAVITILTAYC